MCMRRRRYGRRRAAIGRRGWTGRRRVTRRRGGRRLSRSPGKVGYRL
jgi:hypothetical protein